MSEELNSTLLIAIERELQPNSGEYISREMRVHIRNPNIPGEVIFRKGYGLSFNDLGGPIAFVPVYRNGLHDELGVDTVIEIDGGPVFYQPVIVEHTTKNTAGFTLTGHTADEGRLARDRSSESIMLRSGGTFVGPLQAGFTPEQEVTYSLGQTLDQKNVRLKITDMRPKSPAGIPPLEPVSRL